MTNPLISVIMSVYNSKEYLNEAIESVLFQTYSNFEFLICDDFSTDNSLDIIESYAKKDNRIKVFRNNENKGLPSNLNHLIRYSTGDFIARMDADDICLKNRFEIQINFFLNNSEIDVLGSFTEEFDSLGNVKIKKYPISKKEVFKKISCISPVSHPTVVFRKTVFENLEYNHILKRGQDIDLWFKVLERGMIISNVSQVLLKFRLGDNFKKRRNLSKNLLEFKIYFKGTFRLKGFSIWLLCPIIRLFGVVFFKFLMIDPNKLNVRKIIN